MPAPPSFRCLAASLALLAALFASAIPAAANENARQQWLDAYLQMERADRFANDGENTSALADYQAARLRLEKLARDFPHWNTPMIAYRLEYCRMRLEKLLGQTDDATTSLNRDDLLKLLKEEQARNLRLNAELDHRRQEPPAPTPAPTAAEPEPKPAPPPAPATASDQPAPAPAAPLPALPQEATDHRLALTAAQLDADRLARDNARLQESLAKALERAQTAETSASSWKKAAAGAEKIRQSLAEILLERDALALAARQAELDRLDRDSKINVLSQQLADAERRARTPSNHRAADRDFNSDEWRRQAIALEQKIAPFLAREEENRSQEQALSQLKTKAWAVENNGDAASAARYWTLLADKMPADPMPALRAAVWYSRLADGDHARAWADHFFQRSFPDASQLLLLASTMLEQGQWERSLALAAWAVAQAPDSADAWHTLGAVFVAAALLTPGEAQFRHALDLNPKHAPSLAALAVLLAVAKPPRLQEAKTLYQQAIAAGSPPEPALENIFATLSGEHSP